jgi:hypothetical protein
MFADAENPRACGVAFTAAQRISPYQPFMGVVLAGTKTVLSLHAVQTNQSRTELPLIFSALLTQHLLKSYHC